MSDVEHTYEKNTRSGTNSASGNIQDRWIQDSGRWTIEDSCGAHTMFLRNNYFSEVIIILTVMWVLQQVERTGSRWTDVSSYAKNTADTLKYKLDLFATAQSVMSKIADV